MADVILLLENTELDPDSVREMTDGLIEDSVEIVIVDPGYMRVLNRRYRHLDKSTDVLSFDLSSPEDDSPQGTIYVDGRLFPAMDDRSPMTDLLERVFHGYLHLCGFTHDTDSDSLAMSEAVDKLVRRAFESGKSC